MNVLLYMHYFQEKYPRPQTHVILCSLYSEFDKAGSWPLIVLMSVDTLSYFTLTLFSSCLIIFLLLFFMMNTFLIFTVYFNILIFKKWYSLSSTFTQLMLQTYYFYDLLVQFIFLPISKWQIYFCPISFIYICFYENFHEWYFIYVM